MRVQTPFESLPMITAGVWSSRLETDAPSAFSNLSISCFSPVTKVQPLPALNFAPHAFNRSGVSVNGSTLIEMK